MRECVHKALRGKYQDVLWLVAENLGNEGGNSELSNDELVRRIFSLV
ncbi:hypothetical protein COLO4_20129 [Corchorus olitorius]|uniref:Uncharacterized protein n=1 Tax=Corchorus olitorius TaxID=93759 RepID=A0A1R3J1H9_9ROSI|nr:hypothetical protein COLO4_20129 [Corchorus olitorius]